MSALATKASWCSDVEPKMMRFFVLFAAQRASVVDVDACPSLSTAIARVFPVTAGQPSATNGAEGQAKPQNPPHPSCTYCPS